MSDVLERLQTAVGQRYRIERELGRGGMATVYVAHDPKHDREVALKVLHPELTALLGPERFLREINIIAKLNHPHILPLHDSGSAGPFLYYVMPFIEGESLRAKLNRERQLPIEQAVEFGRQVASALDYAHRHGIIHRDIKPENILLQDREAVVSDFGIALAVHAAAGERITETGLSLGTPEYMSPEQATGELTTDPRSDIYSLGCVLYEMLAGSPPHSGPTAQAIIAKVLTERPTRIRSLRDTVTPAIEEVISRALARLPADRYTSAGEMATALADAAPHGAAVAIPRGLTGGFSGLARAARRVRWTRAAPWTLAALGLAVGVWGVTRGSGGGWAPARLEVTLPRSQHLAGGPSPPIAISPGGSQLVYVAHAGGPAQLYVRPLGEFTAQPLAGTAGAVAPFFSPDGQWIGFFADGMLKRIEVTGGIALEVADAPWSASFGYAASWGDDEMIIFAPGLGTGLLEVSSAGGSARELTTPDPDVGELGHGWPQVLPGGDQVVFTIATADSRQIALLDRRSGERRTIRPRAGQAAGAQYVPTGHLLYAQSGALFATAFDPSRPEVSESPVSVLDGIYTFGSGLAYFAVSRRGSLVYAPGDVVAAENALVWVDLQGQPRSFAADRGRYLSPRVSPDGRRIAVAIEEGGKRDIWVYDVESGRRTRLTLGGATDTDPVWTPDGRRITFSSNRAGSSDLYWKAADGSGAPELLLDREHAVYPHAWSPDGGTLAFYELSPNAGRDIWTLSVQDGSASPLIVTKFNERSPTPSPDSKWLVYVSDESGQDEVYVRPYPAGGARWAVSTDGGREPIWTSNGERIFYRQGDRVLVVAIQTSPTFRAGQPEVLFEGRYEAVPMSSGSLNFDAAPDGRNFVMIQRNQESVPRQLRVVLDWFDELARRVPGGR
jgi:serine/threonine-protein kinase